MVINSRPSTAVTIVLITLAGASNLPEIDWGKHFSLSTRKRHVVENLFVVLRIEKFSPEMRAAKTRASMQLVEQFSWMDDKGQHHQLLQEQ